MRPLVWILLVLSVGAYAAEDPVLAEIEGKPISASQVRFYVKKRPLLAGYLQTGYAGWRRVLEDLIVLRLLNREGQRLGLPRGVEDDEDLYALRVKRQLLPACTKPDAQAAKRFYRDHPELFSTPVLVRLDRIELPAGAKIEGQQALAFLREAAARVRAGQILLRDLTRFCPQGKDCLYDLGFVRLDGLEDSLLKPLKDARPGEVVGPVPAGEFVFLYQVTARREPILTPWRQAKAEAAEVALRFCRQQAFAQLKAELYDRYRVILREDTLRAVQ